MHDNKYIFYFNRTYIIFCSISIDYVHRLYLVEILTFSSTLITVYSHTTFYLFNDSWILMLFYNIKWLQSCSILSIHFCSTAI